MSLTPSNRNNPCPICEATSGNCRQGREDQNYWQCMTYADSRKGEIHNGYKCIGHTRDSLWAQFRLDNSQQWSEQQRQDWQRENQRRRNQQASENEQRRQRSLSAPQRHEQYTKLLSELTLHPDDRADLVRRGFTHEQIELAGFKSIGRYHQLQSQYSELLPGISRGNRLIIADQGYLCPVRNADGLIVACQVRLRSLPSTESARYRWLSGGGQTLHLYPEGCKPEGELPLPVFRPQGKPEGIALAEGTGAKPFLVSQRFNLFTIGAAGGQWPSSPELFRLILEKAEIEVKTKEIKILPDAGDILNPSVMTRWQRVIDLLEQWGWSVAIGWWGQADKSHPDIDELTDHSKIEFIKPEEFLALADFKPTEQQKGFTKHSQAKPFERNYLKPIRELPKTGFHVVRRSQDELLQVFDALQSTRGKEWLQLRQFTPDVTINSQYFDYDFKPGENIASCSGLGTGKSYFANAKWLANSDEGAILGGYRNCLNEQFCAKGEELNGNPWYQIQSDLKNSQDAVLINDPQSRIAGAVDSWVYFASHNFDDKRVIFDEVESVAKHLNQSDTAVSFYREIIKQRVQTALQNSKANLIADGNLRDFTVEYFEKLSGRKFTKILNEYKGNRGHIYLFNGSSRKRKATEEDVKNGLANEINEWISFDRKPSDYSKLHRIMMELPIDIPCLILSDSQKKCEAWDTELAALGRKVFRLDSTNSQTDLGKEFLEDPKEFIFKYKIDCVILSPSAESGISIELQDELKREIPGYFKYEFGFFFGVSVTDTIVQFLGRNRDPFTIKFAYIQPHSIELDRQITNEDKSTTIQQNWTDLALYCASLSLEGLEEGEILRLATNEIQKKLADPHLQYESKLVLKESFERANPRLCLEYALREAGWGVTVIEGREDTIEDLQALQTEIAQERAVAVFQSQYVAATESEKLARKLNKTPEERHQITKSRLLTRLPGIETKTIVEQVKVTVPEQLQKIEQCDLTTIVTVGNISYKEWKESSQPLPEKGIEIKVEKPAFSPDFIHKVLDKDRAFVSRLEVQYLLRHPELCKIVQQHKWHKKLSAIFDPDSVTFGGLPVSRYRSRWVEVHTLLEMGMGFFLNCENNWHNESPEAIAFWEQGSKPHIAKRIGIKHEDDPCTYIGKVLKKFGLKTTQSKQKSRPDKTRYREYSIAPLDSLSQAVYECVEQRINSQVSEFVFDWKKIVQNSTFGIAQTSTEQALQAAHLPPDNYIKTRVEVCSVARTQEEPASTVVCTSLTPTEEVVEALPYCQSAEDLRLIAEGYPVEVMEDAIALQNSQPLRQQLREWWELAQSSVSQIELSNCLSRCVNIPAFRQIIEHVPDEEVRAAIERLSRVDRDRLLTYWREMQRQDEARVNSFAQRLLAAFQEGIEAFKGVLSALGICDRWKAIEQFELLSPDKMQHLMQVEPNWFELCG